MKLPYKLYIEMKLPYKLFLTFFIMLKFKKIYIDSSYKVSGTSSDFIIDLPETVQLEDNVKCILHEVNIPHSWFSIQQGFNDNLYFFQLDPNGVNPNIIDYRVFSIGESNYSGSELAERIQFWLNDYFDTRSPDVIRTDTYTVTYDTRLNKITIAVNYANLIFNVFTEAEVIANQNEFTGIDVSNLHSINMVLNTVDTLPTHGIALAFVSGFSDLVPVKNLYLHCNEICNYNQLSVAGNSSIVKKIPDTVPYLGIINDNEISDFDYIDVSGKILRRCNFRFSDEFNKTVNFNNVECSFTLAFIGINKYLRRKSRLY